MKKILFCSLMMYGSLYAPKVTIVNNTNACIKVTLNTVSIGSKKCETLISPATQETLKSPFLYSSITIINTGIVPGHGEILPENLTYKFNSTLGNCFDKKVEIWRDDKLNDDTEVVRRTFIVKQITR